jgi:hypothetical protein
LILDLPGGSWRARRERTEVRINGRVRERLQTGKPLELILAAGTYRVQVGREVFAMGQVRFFGSPTVTVTLPAEGEVRIRVDPSGVPVFTQMRVSESTYRLTVDGPDGTSVTELPAEVETAAGGIWLLSPMTRGLLQRQNPARSWQAGVSILYLLCTAYVIVAVALADHVRTVTWIWTALIAGTALMIVSSWISLTRARAKLRRSRPG